MGGGGGGGFRQGKPLGYERVQFLFGFSFTMF